MGAFGRSKLKSKKRKKKNTKIFRNKPYNDESMKEYFIDLVDTKANQMRHDYNNPNVFFKGTTDIETIKKQVLWKLTKALESSSIEYEVSKKDFHECKFMLETFLNNLQIVHEDYEDHEELHEDEYEEFLKFATST